MNSITDLLDLEDSDINISDIIVEGQTKTLIIETPPVAHYCPTCGYRMHSRGVKKRTINHPILQDGYSLIPLSVYLKGSRVKVKVGLGKGKKLYDKRQSAAEKDAKRQIERAMKERY